MEYFDNSVDISRKLEKEVGQLNNLKELLARSSQVSNNMVNILDSFEHRLARLETTILPVYQQTGNLQRRQHNTMRTLQALDHVIGFYNVAGKVEGVIRERPSSIGIPQYLEAMESLYVALKYFESNNPQSVELENVTTLFEMGTAALSKEFRDELNKYQKPVPPIVTLDLIALDENEVTEEALSQIKLVPPAVGEDLQAIATWLDKHGDTDRLIVYAKLRSSSLMKSLQVLKDYQRSNSSEKGASSGTPLGGSHGSPGPHRSRLSKLDITPKSRSNKISILERKANRMLQKALAGQLNTRKQGSTSSPSYPLHGTPAMHGGVTPTGSTGKDVLEDDDIDLYLTQVSALHRLAWAELILARQLVPPDQVTCTFELILREPMDQLVSEGENLASQARRCVSHGELQALLSVLGLLKHVTMMQPEYNSLVSECQPSTKAKFDSIVSVLQETCSKALESYVDSLKTEGDRALPKDGTVHEVTSNALIFLEQLIDYASTLALMLQKDCQTISSDSQCKLLLGLYIKRVLANLGLTIMHRSESYSDSHLRAIFRLNNYNYILKTLHSSDLLPYVASVEKDCDLMYNEQILEQKKLYSQSWSRALNYINHQDDIPFGVLQSGKLRDRDRQLIKDMFVGFNKELEELQRVQRSYSIPDRELRESLKRDNKEFILPTYQAFYDRYMGVQFSKNTEKYVKYTPLAVSNIIDKFFDIAA